ncbi:MAPK kinase substrate protein [Camellia lanceoleosa]|uniref:MAPK kinase substrate protein n=1 Tax=Camellia lanceoleosa TaxID=1840588 RepID=A0ACC0G580_9ERIC|nr:MAPK kinase substrate protein [Camellia lanceoleosa]
MAALQRSTKSFRREGSSGLVWDDKLLIENMSENPQKEVDQLMHCQSTNRSGMAMKEHGGSNGASSSFFARSFSTPVKNLRGSRKPPMAKNSQSKVHA